MPSGVYIRTKENTKNHSISMIGKRWKVKNTSNMKGNINVRTEEWKRQHSEDMKGNTNALGKHWRIKNTNKMGNKMGNKYTLGKTWKMSEKSKKKCSESAIIRMQKDLLNNKKVNWTDTDIEVLMEKVLLDNKFIIAKQYLIKNVGFVDFYLPEENLVIECDGDYWHNYPIGTKNDIKRTNKLKELGYKILRFWGKEIKQNLNGCLEQVMCKC